MILSSHGLLVTHTDKNYKLTRYTLSEVMAQAVHGPIRPDAKQAKFCKEVLTNIRNASAEMEGKKKGSVG